MIRLPLPDLPLEARAAEDPRAWVLRACEAYAAKLRADRERDETTEARRAWRRDYMRERRARLRGD